MKINLARGIMYILGILWVMTPIVILAVDPEKHWNNNESIPMRLFILNVFLFVTVGGSFLFKWVIDHWDD